MPKLSNPQPAKTPETKKPNGKKKPESKKPSQDAKASSPEVKPVSESSLKPGKPSKAPELEIVYPKLQIRSFGVQEHLVREGEEPTPLTGEIAKELLGWEEEGENTDFKNNYLLDYEVEREDAEGKKVKRRVKVRCTNNLTNRPYYPQLAEDWMMDILLGNWNYNGETIIVDRYGNVQDGQHRLIGLILAIIEWHRDQNRSKSERKWQEYWKEEPWIEGLVVLGIDPSDKVINTIGTGKRRTLADALYRHSWFNTLDPKSREHVAKIMEFATKLLWNRTAQQQSSLTPERSRRTHSESFDFIERHKRLIECVKFIREEAHGKKPPLGITQFIPISTAGALLYLMGSAATDPSEEGNQKRYDITLNESSLDWSLWDKAQEFWVDLINNGPKTEHLREAMIALPSECSAHYLTEMPKALIIKAWNLYSDGTKIMRDGIEVETTMKDGYPVLLETPRIGGIDVG